MTARIAHNALHRWHEEVDQAPSVPQVVATVQEFLATLPAGDLQRIPEDCRPREVFESSDIDAWNLRLAEAVKALWATEGDHEVLTEVAQLFLRASVKMSRLSGADTPPPPLQ